MTELVVVLVRRACGQAYLVGRQIAGRDLLGGRRGGVVQALAQVAVTRCLAISDGQLVERRVELEDVGLRHAPQRS